MTCRKALYAAALTALDVEMARLFAGLGAEVAARTSLIITSDHGEELWDHAPAEYASAQHLDRWGVDHGHTLYEELVHVPLLLVPPLAAEAPPQARSEALVSIADVFATVLGLAGAGAAGRGTAHDLSTILSRPLWTDREYALSETTLYGPDRVAVTTPELRAIFTEPNETVVFDRLADPQELRPLPADGPLARRGAALLDLVRVEWMDSHVQERP
ncbi:MAG: sulfatase-like hydrolase/transferase [Deltaproteobacteria bacterium]|nr:sulfatase-like hydrolase/transferase [Deltaproteobacteria bacterium]